MKKIVTIIILVICLFGIGVGQAAAQGNPFNFGGLVGYTHFCTCTLNWWIFVTPPKTAALSYYYTPQFANYMLPQMGVWTLGLYTPGATCLDWYPGFPPYCAPAPVVPPTGTILPQVGTSF
jgi:hypothetical protein